MVILHIEYEDGRERNIYTVESRVDEDLENAKQEGTIKSWNVRKL